MTLGRDEAHDAADQPCPSAGQAALEVTADDAVVGCDTTGRIVEWSDGARAIFGYQPDEVIGEHLSVLYTDFAVSERHPLWVLEQAARVGRLAEDGWRRHQDGSRFWSHTVVAALHDSRGGVRGYEALVQDLSEHRAMADALRRAQALFQLTFEAAPSGMAVLTAAGRFTRVNDALCRLLGRSREALLETSVVEIFPGDDCERAALWEAARHSAEPVDVRLEGSETALGWVQLSARPLSRINGEPELVVLQVEDIDRHMALNQALIDAEQAKSQFVAVASHELRTPLTAILGYTSTLRRRWNNFSDAQRQDAVELIHDQARRLRLLIEDLLTVSSFDAGGVRLTRVPTDVGAVISEVVKSLGFPIRVEAAATATVSVDPLRLEQILTNLLTNANKYGRAPFDVCVDATDAFVSIRITDHGDGVPESFVPIMFDRFTQAFDHRRRGRSGAGLGLAIVKTLTEAHDGTLSYRTAPSGGAEFEIKLPRVPGLAELPETPQQRTPQQRTLQRAAIEPLFPAAGM